MMKKWIGIVERERERENDLNYLNNLELVAELPSASA